MTKVIPQGTLRKAKPLLSQLATTIAHEHLEVQKAVSNSIQHAFFNAGKALRAAKRQLGHGEFELWLRPNCDCSIGQAQRYMRLAKKLPQLEDANAARALDLKSLRQALQYISAMDALEECEVPLLPPTDVLSGVLPPPASVSVNALVSMVSVTNSPIAIEQVASASVTFVEPDVTPCAKLQPSLISELTTIDPSLVDELIDEVCLVAIAFANRLLGEAASDDPNRRDLLTSQLLIAIPQGPANVAIQTEQHEG